MKPVTVKFEYREADGGVEKTKMYEKTIEFSENIPVAFHAINQWGYTVYHFEKLALKARIEELEQKLQQASSK